jgi:hypothetical protein
MRLTMPNRSKVLRASRSIRVTVTTSPGGEAAQHPQKFAPVAVRARHFLAVDVPAAASGRAQLLKLCVKGPPVGRDAGITDKPFLRMSFGHILRHRNPLILRGKENLPKILVSAMRVGNGWIPAVR